MTALTTILLVLVAVAVAGAIKLTGALLVDALTLLPALADCRGGPVGDRRGGVRRCRPGHAENPAAAVLRSHLDQPDLLRLRPHYTTVVRGLAGQWRPNLLFVTAAVIAVGGYLAALVRLRARGERWPAGRTIAWLIGWLLIIVVTSSGLGKYSGADFAVHMGVHMALSMLIPIPLVLGGPLTLALKSLPSAPKDTQPGPHEWIVAVLHSRVLRALYHPLFVFTVYIGSYYALYLTDAFGTLMKFHWAHQLMNVHFLVVGCLYFGLIVGSGAGRDNRAAAAVAAPRSSPGAT